MTAKTKESFCKDKHFLRYMQIFERIFESHIWSFIFIGRNYTEIICCLSLSSCESSSFFNVGHLNLYIGDTESPAKIKKCQKLANYACYKINKTMNEGELGDKYKAMVCTMDVLKPDWDRFREKDGRGFNLLPSLRYIH